MVSIMDGMDFSYVGTHDENPNIHELILTWYSVRDEDTSWITIAYNEDTNKWGIGQSNLDAPQKQINSAIFEYIDSSGSSCHALSCMQYVNYLDTDWNSYSEDIEQIYDEYMEDTEKFDKLIKRLIIDGQL